MHSDLGARLLLIAGIVIIALLSWGIVSNIEIYEDTGQTSWSVRALRNPYLAAQQFIQQSGIKSVESDSLIGLDKLDSVATVLITDANQALNPRQLEQLLSWLENGGNLIVTANSTNGSDDLLLEKFNVDTSWPSRIDIEAKNDNPDQPQDAVEDDTSQKEDGPSISKSFRDYNEQIDAGKDPRKSLPIKDADDSLTVIDFDAEIGSLEIAFRPYPVLTHPYPDGDVGDEPDPVPFSWTASEYGTHLIQFEVGNGMLTIISDPSIWTSQRIDQYDHAYLLWVLSSKHGDFAILHPGLRDSIWVLIASHAFEFLIALALSMTLLLWHLGHRFGRIVSRDTAGGRALSEHFFATANYLWHRKAGKQLIEPVRQQIFRRASIVLAGFTAASNDPAQQRQLIAHHCGLEVVTVNSALQASDFNEASFLRTVKLLKYIEQSL